jgi:hypothetical protein
VDELGMTALGLPKCFMRSASVITVYIKCVKQLQKDPKTANLMIAPRGSVDVPEYVIWVHELKLYESDACGLSTVGRI